MIRWRRAAGGRSNDDPPTTPVPESETSRIDEYSRRRPAAHPGSANYPAGDGRQRGRAHASVGDAYLPPRTHNPHLPPLDESPTVGATRAMPDDSAADASAKGPKKITVMRVAAMRGRELTCLLYTSDAADDVAGG